MKFRLSGTLVLYISLLMLTTESPALGQVPTTVPTAQVSGNTNLCVGGSGIIQAALTGTAPWNLVWSDGFTQTAIALSPAMRFVSPTVTTSYSVLSVSDAGNTTGLSSGVAIVRVSQSPVISSQPVSAALCAGGTVTFSVVASGVPSDLNGSAAVMAGASDQKKSCACLAAPLFSSGSGVMPPWISQSNAVIVSISGGRTSFVYQAQTAARLAKRPDTILVKPKKQIAQASLAAHHQKIGAIVKRTFSRFGNLQVVKLPPGLTVEQAIKQYQDSGLVEYAEPDYQVHAVLSPNDPRYLDGSLWNLNNTGQNGGTPHADISAPAGWDIRTSADPIIVAVIDTGVWYPHEDLASNMWVNPCVNCPVDGVVYSNDVHGINVLTGTGDPMDDMFHGTHCAGIIGAVGNNGIGGVGVAWNVRIMACKFLDATGTGFDSDAITCIDYAVSKGAKVLSCSWGGSSYSQAVHDAIAGARDADVIFVAAAGNDTSDNDAFPFYPASYDSDLNNVVAVAATDQNDQLAGFSNYGATLVALGAPGVNILSTLPGIETAAMQSYGLTTNYGALNGTSMACPHVAGVMALVCAQYPTDSCSQIIQRVLGNTDPVSSLNGRTLTGGRLDLLNALTQPPQSPFWPSYQWRMNGTNIPGQTGSSCSFGPVTINDDGDLFDVVVSNQCDTVISTAAVLTVDTPCQITNQPTGVIQCVSNPATLWVSATGTHINYRWRKIDGGWDSPWVLENSGPGSGNLFIGSSTNNGDCTYNPLFPTDIDTNGVAFGINASGGHTMQVTRSMIEPLQPGDVFTVSMDNGYVDADGAAGFAVYSADNQKWFEFFCTNNVYYWTVENLPPQAASVAPFTSHGISFYFDMMFPGQLLIVIQDPSADTGIIFEDFLPDLANDPPNHIVLYNRNAGSGPTHDVYFNNFASYENYDLNDLIGYDNAAETAYTNGWHNGDNGGTGPIAGATNNQYIIPSCALADSGIYDVIMENSCSFLTSANIPLTVQPSPCVPIDALDHFAWGSIPSPRFINTPFSVIIRAQDMTNGLFTNFPGTTILGTTNGIAVSPPVSGNFTQGVWTGAVVVSQTASNLVLRANDGLGHFGLANPINVISLPQLGMLRSGNIALYIWPAGYSGFVLETSGNLSPASWAPVPYSPIQTGDQYLLPLDMPGTNGFYRLRFPGP